MTAFLSRPQLRLGSGTSSVQDMSEARTGKKALGCVLPFSLIAFLGNPVISHVLRRRCRIELRGQRSDTSSESRTQPRGIKTHPRGEPPSMLSSCLLGLLNSHTLFSFSLLSVPGDRGATILSLEWQPGCKGLRMRLLRCRNVELLNVSPEVTRSGEHSHLDEPRQPLRGLQEGQPGLFHI